MACIGLGLQHEDMRAWKTRAPLIDLGGVMRHLFTSRRDSQGLEAFLTA